MLDKEKPFIGITSRAPSQDTDGIALCHLTLENEDLGIKLPSGQTGKDNASRRSGHHHHDERGMASTSSSKSSSESSPPSDKVSSDPKDDLVQKQGLRMTTTSSDEIKDEAQVTGEDEPSFEEWQCKMECKLKKKKVEDSILVGIPSSDCDSAFEDKSSSEDKSKGSSGSFKSGHSGRHHKPTKKKTNGSGPANQRRSHRVNKNSPDDQDLNEHLYLEDDENHFHHLPYFNDSMRSKGKGRRISSRQKDEDEDDKDDAQNRSPVRVASPSSEWLFQQEPTQFKMEVSPVAPSLEDAMANTKNADDEDIMFFPGVVLSTPCTRREKWNVIAEEDETDEGEESEKRYEHILPEVTVTDRSGQATEGVRSGVCAQGPRLSNRHKGTIMSSRKTSIPDDPEMSNNNNSDLVAATLSTASSDSRLVNQCPGGFPGQEPMRSGPGGVDPDADKEVLQPDERTWEVKQAYPDGGFGWWVLFGSIVVNILIPGTIKSFGILYVSFLEEFKATPADAAWIPALSYWLYSSVGPLATGLCKRYSHRSVTIFGGILCALGMALSSFAQSLTQLCFTYGILTGFGAGLVYPVGILIVSKYFNKKRGLANGLCTSGSALGSFVIPPLMHFLITAYGLRGTVLIMGGILLNVCLAALCFEPVERHQKWVRVSVTDGDLASAAASPGPVRNSSGPQPGTQSERVDIVTGGNAPIREIAASMPIAIPQIPTDPRRGSGSIRRATFQIGHETPHADSWSSNEGASPLAARLLREDIFVPGSPRVHPNSGIGKGRLHPSGHSGTELETLGESCTSGGGIMPANPVSGCQSRLNLTAIPEDEDATSEVTPEVSRRDWSFYNGLTETKQRLLRLSTGASSHAMTDLQRQSEHPSASGLSRTLSVASNVSNSSFHYVNTAHHGCSLAALQMDKNIPEFGSTLTLKSLKQSCVPRRLRECFCSSPCQRSCQKQSDDEADTEQGIVIETKRSSESGFCSKFIDWSLLNDGVYRVILMSNSTTALGYTNFTILLPAYAIMLGFNKTEASWLLSALAFWDFCGRIGGGALADKRFISRKWFYIIGLFCSGVSLSFLPLVTSYSVLLTFCCIFGLASGVYIGVLAVILGDQLGLDKLGSSFGISLLVNGTLNLLGPPVSGFIVEKSSYKVLFTILGLILIFGSFLWGLIPIIERRRARQEPETHGPQPSQRPMTSADLM